MEYPSLLLLLVLAASVCSAISKCPPSEDVYPCECEVDYVTEDMILKCKNKDTTLSQLKKALSHFSEDVEMISIDFKNLALGKIPSNIFEGLAVKEMTISNCEIDFEGGEPPLKGLDKSLQFLTIKSSLTQENVEELKLDHLKKLEMLELSNNKITEIGDGVFADGLPALFFLEFKDNGIEKIGEKAFDNLKNIRYFTLSGNKFDSLRRNMIPTSADRLEDLTLKDNGAVELSEDFFTSMPSLEFLTLSGNEITTLERNTWENILDQLSLVVLDDNPLQCDSEMEWLFEKRKARIFYGTCAGPEGMKGESFESFLRKGEKGKKQ